MVILSIDTSCDETAVAVTSGRRILTNEIYSQILIHKKWGGVVPHLAKRAHEERIDLVVGEALRTLLLRSKNLLGSELASLDKPAESAGKLGTGRASSELGIRDLRRRSLAQTSTSLANSTPKAFEGIDYIAVTYGPGLAPALEVGIKKAKELAKRYSKKIIPVDHMEGHIYSCFAQNSRGNPARPFTFPYLALLVSGGHTELVRFDGHVQYEILGETLDDAAGEALDKIAKLMGLGYPGGPVIECLAQDGDPAFHSFPRPMRTSADLNFSYSGLKTSFYYFFRNMDQEERVAHMNDLAASFQEAVFDSLLFKLEQAIKETRIRNVLVAGGVAVNMLLHKKVRALVGAIGGKVYFPPYKILYGDNAAMIGVAAHYKAKQGIFIKDVTKFDRVPRLRLGE